MDVINETVAGRQQLPNATGKSAINCGTCSKSFLTRRDYNRHRKTHDRPFHCGLCPRKYALKTDLERHGAQHEHSSARFRCAWPGCEYQGSTRKDNLLRHMNRRHLADANAEEQETRKMEVLRLYKKATENEKLLRAQRARKITLLEAAIRGEESIVRHMRDNTQACDAAGGPPLSEAMLSAAEYGNMNVVSLLIAKGAPLDVEDYLKRTPLLLAAEKGHVAVVKHLLEHGAVVDAKNWEGDTPLLLAAKHGHKAVVKLLLEVGAKTDLGYEL